MKTCMNLSATIWPAKTVAKAARLGWLGRGRGFSLGRSHGYRSYNYEINCDQPEGSR